MKTTVKCSSWLLVLCVIFSSFCVQVVCEEKALPSTSLSSVIPTTKTSKVCLTMIVKNESAIISRCLDAALPVIDCISICDTGSTDNTVAIIENYMKEHKLPGKVHQHVWKNFGTNRTLSAQAAQETLKEIGFPLESTYLLLLDADMLLEVMPEFKKADLQGDSYSLMQCNGDISYSNIRLVRASLPWECVGVTHEYWRAKGARDDSVFQGLSIDDWNDGGCKSDKFERDLKLLTQGLIDEPNNERYMFYLAQTYHCLSQHADSNRWYQARIDQGGWFEEVWYSKYMLGVNYEAMGDWDKALEAYTDAYLYNPKRAEPIYNIAKYYRLNQQYLLAYLFAKLGKGISYPKDQYLFISDTIYDYEFDEELSIIAYYTPFKQEGLEASHQLLLNKYAPEEVKEQCYRNICFYVEKLPIEKIIRFTSALAPVKGGVKERYFPSSSAILPSKEGYTMNCRMVNYKIGSRGEYIIFDENQYVKTKNFFLRFDKNFKLIDQKEIVENFPRKLAPSERKIVGLEDVRLFSWKDKVYFTCNTVDTSPDQFVEITFGSLTPPDPNKETIEVEAFVPFSSQLGTECEKNWLPFVKNDTIYYIYSYDPFLVFSFDPDKNVLKKALSYDPEIDASAFRGSASPIPLDGGYLLLVHEVVFNEKRAYLHRFVFLDDNLKMKKVSKPFIFQHVGIEFCVGMTIDHSGKKLLIPFSYEDGDAKIAQVDLDVVRSLLESIPN